MSKLRVAIIGTGMIANSAHFPALNILRKEGLVDVVGVADIRETAAAETAKRHDVPNWYTDPQKMLDELKPDFVAVCTPNMYHKEWTIKALKSGAHVACEADGSDSCRCRRNVADRKRMRKAPLPVSVYEMEKLYATVKRACDERRTRRCILL